MQKRKHKHFVALPLFFSVFIVSCFFSGIDFFSPRLVQGSLLDNGFFIHKSGVVGKSTVGSVVDVVSDVVRFSNGSAVIAGDGELRVEVNDLHIIGLRGAFSISTQSNQVTVAALTSPVVVEADDEILMIVPIGNQWTYEGQFLELFNGDVLKWRKGRELQRIPDSFIRRQAATMLELHKRLEDVSCTSGSGAQVQLAACEVSTLSSNDDAWLPTLEAIQKDNGLFLVGLYHPQYRDSMWLIRNTLPKNEKILQLLHMPFSHSKEVWSKFILDDWSRQLQILLSEYNDISNLWPHLFTWYELLPERFMSEGRPYQAKLLAQAFVRLFDKQYDFLLTAQQKQLQRWRRGDIGHGPEVVVSTNTSSVVANTNTPKVIHTEDYVEIDTNAIASLMQDAGGIFTADTLLTVQNTQSVLISHLLFMGKAEAHEISFVYYPGTHMVSDIVFNGKKQPLSMSFKQMVEWVKTE